MDKIITTGKLKDKPPFRDSSSAVVPAKVMCHNCSKLKIFLGALAFSFFAKGFSGSYMKSMSSQIERRFEISSSIFGIIDGSFELGNLMVMVLVSYLGPRVHRPKVIAVGCLIMSLGAFLSVMPQFLMGRYNYERIAVTVDNSSTSVSACSPASSVGHSVSDATETPSTMKNSGCEKTSNSYLWLFVLMGNLLRGIGEAPVMPLGVSYIDDFSKEENSAFYIGLVRSSGMFGPTLGFLLGSFCASLWVDIGVVDIDAININPKDTRWVGAWWLGLLICGAVNFIASLPFFFLPYSLIKEGEDENPKKISHLPVQGDHCKTDPPAQPQLKFSEAVKDFLPTLKKLFGNPVFLVYVFLTILQYNSLVGLITYETKFMEQQFNVSVAKAIFLVGVILLPITILGMFLGGYLIKKFKLHITGMAKFACISFIVAYLLNLLYFMCNCEVLQLAGLTVPYSGFKQLSSPKNSFMSSCNADCSCKVDQWDPVCGDNGITYMTACFAGCKSSTGMGKNMVFHNCSCVEGQEHGHGNASAVLGQCQRESCTKAFPYFLALQTACAFILALGGTPTYMIMFRSVSPDLKSFAVGIETLGGRILGGLPAPIYFGALIDETCLKWGTKSCGGSGSCRIYDTKAFRNVYLGLIAGLRAGCCVLYLVLCVLIMRRFKTDDKDTTDIKNAEETINKESVTVNKKEALPGAKTSEESEETCM
ncbi:solute carrier organic anion transporter family member 1C1 isoform X1 [Gallus gallus]|uniref:Solute carrier organic anion transporter family member n=1 Tax=Gallus gallus TaxID=9031 RepID=F1NPJ5_CHICK|nr:solute carrier organic anion transporter family member 1C1 isoform X1 [Gallus gallus]XP_040518308.1 solute carrier organic anion transporter family member 1C1 isoform X1 [Gallus gallus]XP_040518309.1 solute carrier organic anion transporter family member 1C1 isoform X1 [Gallus gallus]XP_416420.4 solute carrier organic anion transporter family member 1C1 isoform X1 [Gallus gallus]|eukprot:XP_416420.4 solute carrier organic anion transporter family member 1C1 isoform X1 [Gallus gallus]